MPQHSSLAKISSEEGTEKDSQCYQVQGVEAFQEGHQKMLYKINNCKFDAMPYS